MDKSPKKKIEKRTTELTIAAFILLLTGAAVTTSNSNILDAGTQNPDRLIAEYRFDTGTGNTAHDTSGNNDGAIDGAKWTDGVKGNALSFEGDNNVDIPDNSKIKPNKELTASLWIYPTKSDERKVALLVGRDTNSGYEFRVNTGPQYLVGIQGNSGHINRYIDGIDMNEWQHVTIVYESGNGGSFYKNGKKIASLSDVGDITYPEMYGSSPSIGSHGGIYHYDGEIDDVEIYSKALNDSQVESLYNSGSWRMGEDTSNNDPSKVLDISFQHQNSTHVLDTSGYGNHGEPQNGANQESAVNCEVGRCYNFDGSDDYIETSEIDLGTSDWTVMSWYYPESSDNYGHIFSSSTNQGNFAAKISENLNPYFYSNDGRTDGTNVDESLKLDNWQHLAYTYDGSSIKIYLDGKKINEESVSGLDIPQDSYLIQGGNGEYVEAKHDNLKVFNRSLSQAEIIEKTQGLESNGAVLDMRFDSGGGDYVEDYSMEDNHGSLNPDEVSGPDRVDGLTGEALKFDGTDDQVSISGDSSLHMSDGTWTQVLWAKGEYDGTQRNALRLSGGWQTLMGIYSSDTWRAGFYDGSGWKWLTGDTDTSKLHQIVFVGRENEIELWIDGEEVDSLSTTDSPPSSRDGGGGYLGSVGGDRYYNGFIERVRVFQQPLSSSEIKQLYASGKSHVGSSSGKSNSGLQDGLVLSQSFNRIETCGQSDTISCPSGMSGEVAVDESGEANHGEVNDPSVKGAKDCRVGSCLGFDGVDDRVTSPDSNSLDPEGSMTISFWTMNGEDGQELLPIGKDGVYRFWFSSANSWYFRVNNETGDGLSAGYTAASTEKGEWDHIVGRYDAETNEVSVWINGQKDSANSDSDFGSNLQTNTQPVEVGGGISGWRDENWEGKFDQVRVYNRSLSEEEVWKLYTRGRDRSSGMAGPVGWWRISSESSPLPDVSGEGNDGDLNLLGETGTFNTSDGEWKEIKFERSYANPVVVGTTNTQNGEPALSFEARNVQSNRAEMRVCESEAENSEGCDMHGTERVGYMVINAKATKDIPGIEAGNFKIDSELDSNTKTVSYSESFSNDPYVMANVNSDNGKNPVEARVTSYSKTSFTAGICYQDSSNGCDPGHPTEEVGWVALEPGNLPFKETSEVGSTGNSVGNSAWTLQSFTNTYSERPVVIASTVTEDGVEELQIDEVRNVNTTHAEVRYCEAENGDGCNGHTSEEVAWFTTPEGLLTYSNGNFPRYVDTERGKALEFDGSDDYVEVKDDSGISFSGESFSVSAWIYSQESNQFVTGILGNSDFEAGGYTISSPANANDIIFLTNDDSSQYAAKKDNSAIPPDDWTHVAGVFDGSTLELYVDGDLEDTGNGDITDNSNNLRIGTSTQGGHGGTFNGIIDDVRIYPYALSHEQVKKVMNGGGDLSVG
jgi:hypothetical protein